MDAARVEWKREIEAECVKWKMEIDATRPERKRLEDKLAVEREEHIEQFGQAIDLDLW